MPNPDRSSSLAGAWRLESYARGGVSKEIKGDLFFTDHRWSTLYFVPQEASGEFWASGETGRYSQAGDCLTFFHEQTFQGGAGKPLVIDCNSQVVENCRFELAVETLAIHFPSGGVIRARRHRT